MKNKLMIIKRKKGKMNAKTMEMRYEHGFDLLYGFFWECGGEEQRTAQNECERIHVWIFFLWLFGWRLLALWKRLKETTIQTLFYMIPPFQAKPIIYARKKFNKSFFLQ